MSRRVSAGVVALALITAAPSLAAQVSVGTGYESYSFGDPEAVGVESLSLISTPFTARIPIFAGSALEVSGAYARAALVTASGERLQLQGPTDTRIGLDLPVAGPLRLSAVAVVPTGAHDLSSEEAQVAGVVSSYLLPLRVGYWGSGGGYGGGTSLTQAFTRSGISVGASYLVTREFDAYQNGGAAYRPGNQIRVQALGYVDLSTSARLTVRGSYSNRAEDQLGGTDIYRSGDQYLAMGALTFAAGARGSAMTYAGWLRRGEGERAVEFGDARAPSEDLLLMGVSMRLPAGVGVFVPSGDLRLYRNDAGLDQGYVGGAGVGVELSVGSATAIPTLRGRFGHVEVRTGSASSFIGADVGLTYRFGRRR